MDLFAIELHSPEPRTHLNFMSAATRIIAALGLTAGPRTLDPAQSSPSAGRKRLAAAFAVFVVAAGLRVTRSTGDYFSSDTADYVRAAQAGVWDLYTDVRSTPVTALLEKWKDPAFRKHPADVQYRAGDNMAIRHFHGPGSFYILAASQAAGFDERAQRKVWGVLGAVTCALLAWLVARSGVWLPLALGAGLLAATDSRMTLSDLDPSPPHTFYLLLVMLFFALAFTAFEPAWRSMRLYLCAVVLSWATITFELAAALGVAILAGLAWEIHRGRPPREIVPAAVRFLAAYVVSLALFWIGGVTRGLLALCFVGNMAILRRQDYSGGNPLFPTLMTLYGSYLVSTALFLLFGYALWQVIRNPKLRPSRTESLYVFFACYAGLAFLFGIAARLKNLPYCAEAYFPMLLAMALIIPLAAPRTGNWIAIGTAVTLFAGVLFNLANLPQPVSDPSRDIVTAVAKTARPADGVILVNDYNVSSTLLLYLPGYEVELTKSRTDLTPRHPEMAPRVHMAVLNARGMGADMQQSAASSFPPLFTYYSNGRPIWVGKSKAAVQR